MNKTEKFFELYKKTFFAGFYMYAILLTLKKLNRPSYGYEISKVLEDASGSVFKLTVGTMYPILKKLEKNGLLKSFWSESESGPPRKYYKITVLGEEFLRKVNNLWDEMKKALDKLRGDDFE